VSTATGRSNVPQGPTTSSPATGAGNSSCASLTGSFYEHMFVTVAAGNLTEERLESIERGARERHTLMDRVVLELVEEVRRLRGIIARLEEQ
jgi:hypothetical protein